MTVLRALLLLTLAGLLLAPAPARAGKLWLICDGLLCTSDEQGRGKRVVLGLVGGQPIRDAAVAPDGRRVVATDGTELFLGSPRGRWRELADAGSTSCCHTGRLDWRADGRAFMWIRSFSVGPPLLCLASRSGRNLRCRHETRSAGGIDLFGPRGQLLWKPGDEADRLCVRGKPPAGCGRTVLRAPRGFEPYQHAALSPDGRFIASYLAPFVGSGRLGIFSVASGQLIRRPWVAEGVQVLWTPDGRWVGQMALRRDVPGIRLRAVRGRATRWIRLRGGYLVGWTR